jgi:hypothetical protein
LVVASTICCLAAAQAEDTAASQCPSINELSSFKVRNAKIVDPWHTFRFWSSEDPAAKAVAALEGKPYDQSEVNEVWNIVEQYRLLPLDLQVSYVSVGECRQQELDLTFLVISFFLSPHITIPNKEDPVSAAAPPPLPFRVYPDVGYNATDNLYAGGTAIWSWNSNGIPVNTFRVQGFGSSTARWIDAELKGDRDSTTSWLAHAEWAARYANYLSPTTSADLKGGRLTANFFGYTRPVKSLVFHFGTVAGGGNDQSGFEQTSLAPDVSASSGYSGLKLYGGFTGQAQRQDFSVGYGVELGGSVNTSLLNAWHKQVGNVQYDFWIPFDDHRLLEVEQQFTAGGVGINQTIPVGEMFFGGNRQSYFVSDDSFKLPSNPYIRSLPANSFYHTSQGAGATSFLSYNLTIAATAWRIPLVPSEVNITQNLCDKLIADPTVPPKNPKKQLCKKLKGQFTSATNILEAANAIDDKRLATMQKNLTALEPTLQELLNIAQNANSGTNTSLKSCIAATQSSLSTVQDAVSASLGSAYDDFEDLIPGGNSPLEDVVLSCQLALSSSPAGVSAVTKVKAAADNLKAQLDAIDHDASAKANEFMAYVKRLMFRVLSEVNIVSISPIGVFDVAHIGPADQGPYSGTRYGAG